MKRKTATKPARPEPPPAELDLEPVDDDDSSEQIVARPDGYHWLARDGVQEFGPFATLDEARAAMAAAGEDGAHEPAETLEEAEDEIGISAWIDPETGEPAEGQSPPHLEGD